jgi:hypothetical protein
MKPAGNKPDYSYLYASGKLADGKNYIWINSVKMPGQASFSGDFMVGEPGGSVLAGAPDVVSFSGSVATFSGSGSVDGKKVTFRGTLDADGKFVCNVNDSVGVQVMAFDNKFEWLGTYYAPGGGAPDMSGSV